jgi:hypothetical protein
MFEYHCWAVVMTDGLEAHRALVQALEARIAALPELSRETFHLTRLNEVHVIASGLRNHPCGEVLDVFEWLAEQCPGCYGLMYVRGEYLDEEGPYRFKVRRIRDGTVEQLEDRYFIDTP